jgi:hypothetical protein
MTVTPQDIYQLIKSYEEQFTPPAPYVTINVGTLDVDSGAFNGLTTEAARIRSRSSTVLTTRRIARQAISSERAG